MAFTKITGSVSRSTRFAVEHLTDEMLVALREYQAALLSSKVGGFSTFQRFLRTGSTRNLGIEFSKIEIEGLIKELDRAISQSAITSDTLLFRGVRDGRPTFGPSLERLKVGAIIEESGYVSTTTSERLVDSKFTQKLTVRDRPLVFKIEVPKGSLAFPIDRVKDLGESEVLLPRGSRFKVVKIVGNKVTLRHIPKTSLLGITPTFNELFFDSVIRHQIGLMRLSGSIRNRVVALLDATEVDMADKIRSRLLNHRGLNTPSDVIRMQRLIKVLRGTRITAWKQVTALWVKEMQSLAVAEPNFMDGLVKSSVPVRLDTVIPQTSFLKAIVTSKPFEGKTMRGWANSIARSDLARIEQQIRIGMVQGETGPQIARRIVGTKALRGINGTTEITRRHATAITRTAVNGISNHAKRLYYVENKDLFKEELYVATLDSRTTNICMSLDGNKYPIGEGPIPPVHFQCRSMRIAVIIPDAVGNRPIREFTKKGLVRDYSRRNGLKVQSNRAKLPRGHKGPFDSFAQKRMRDLTGRAPAATTYQEFLGRQTVEFQNDVLGVSRAKLFRDGGLTLDKFVNHTGKLFTLDQLSIAHGAAFKAAGINV